MKRPHRPNVSNISCDLDSCEIGEIEYYSIRLGCSMSQLIRGILRDKIQQLNELPFKPKRLEALDKLRLLGYGVLVENVKGIIDEEVIQPIDSNLTDGSPSSDDVKTTCSLPSSAEQYIQDSQNK